MIENIFINSAFKELDAMDYEVIDFYGDGNCLFYSLKVILDILKKEDANYTTAKELVPFLGSTLLSYYTLNIKNDKNKLKFFEQPSEEEITRLLVNNPNVDSGRDAYLAFNLKFNDIAGCLDLLYREDMKYVIDNPKLDVENLL